MCPCPFFDLRVVRCSPQSPALQFGYGSVPKCFGMLVPGATKTSKILRNPCDSKEAHCSRQPPTHCSPFKLQQGASSKGGFHFHSANVKAKGKAKPTSKKPKTNKDPNSGPSCTEMWSPLQRWPEPPFFDWISSWRRALSSPSQTS